MHYLNKEWAASTSTPKNRQNTRQIFSSSAHGKRKLVSFVFCSDSPEPKNQENQEKLEKPSPIH